MRVDFDRHWMDRVERLAVAVERCAAATERCAVALEAMNQDTVDPAQVAELATELRDSSGAGGHRGQHAGRPRLRRAAGEGGPQQVGMDRGPASAGVGLAGPTIRESDERPWGR
jgi:hypothetical protein